MKLSSCFICDLTSFFEENLPTLKTFALVFQQAWTSVCLQAYFKLEYSTSLQCAAVTIFSSRAWDSGKKKVYVLKSRGEYFLSHELAAPHSVYTVVQEKHPLQEHN